MPLLVEILSEYTVALNFHRSPLRLLQLYFYQRVLQLRAAREQEAQKWIACLNTIQLRQQHTPASAAAKHQLTPVASAAIDTSPSAPPGRKSASTASNGILMITARSSIEAIDGVAHTEHRTDSRGVLPPHLLVEERHVSYSPLSEHAATSPFLSNAHRQKLLDKGNESAARSLQYPRQPVSTAEAATSTEDEAQMDVKGAKRLNFAM